jgi:2-polyprenyl-3-methyl-5-hydroxy-6-metoxy-1,4-benzoquinol methylase
VKKSPIVEQGVIAGNVYDKYGTGNPLARFLMGRFQRSLSELVALTGAGDIHEVGCGEGLLSIQLAAPNRRLRASDFSEKIIAAARQNARARGVDIAFKAASIYDLAPPDDAAELVVCCEVLEHLEDPQRALSALARLANPYLIVSVPREPLWRILNAARGRYLCQLGNTPGHLRHWSKKRFLNFLRPHLKIVKVLTPIPWIMVLTRAERRPSRQGSS